MGKKAKEHRKKVAKRNETIKNEQRKFQKQQHERLMELIEREKQMGSFNNTPNAPTIDIPGLQGPML